MAPRGIGAAVFIVGLILSMTILSGVGYYASLGDVEIDADKHNDDVVAAADSVGNTSFAEGRSGSVLEGPLAVVTPVVRTFNLLVTIVFNTSGIMQLLFGLPAIAADTIQLVFQLSMAVTLLYLVRSGSPV